MIVALFATGTLIFMVENREIVLVGLLGFRARASLVMVAASSDDLCSRRYRRTDFQHSQSHQSVA